jgi:hypothetical protein
MKFTVENESAKKLAGNLESKKENEMKKKI